MLSLSDRRICELCITLSHKRGSSFLTSYLSLVCKRCVYPGIESTITQSYTFRMPASVSNTLVSVCGHITYLYQRSYIWLKIDQCFYISLAYTIALLYSSLSSSRFLHVISELYLSTIPDARYIIIRITIHYIDPILPKILLFPTAIKYFTRCLNVKYSFSFSSFQSAAVRFIASY